MFAETIAEEFHSVAELVWRYEEAGQELVLAKFRVGWIEALIEFKRARFELANAWMVSFDVTKDPDKEVLYAAFHLFNGVFQAVEEFASVYQPSHIIFATKREDLASIYELYLRREGKRIEALGYLLESETVPPFKEYVLRRVGPREWKAYGSDDR